MFGFIKRWMFNRRRAIFRYWDGSRDRSIDPMVPYRKLISDTEFNWETTPILIEAQDEKVSSDALRVTAVAVRDAFEVPIHGDTGGLTEWECLELLQAFVFSMMGLKKSTKAGPISPDVTEPQFSEPSTTKPRSDFGSTSNEPETAQVSG